MGDRQLQTALENLQEAAPAISGHPACDQLVGLYSFPKSGNTWLRAIIIGILEIPQRRAVLASYVPDTHLGQPIGEMPWQHAGQTWCCYKSHNKTPLVQEGARSFRPDKIIYIYRHPLDVFLSYLNYLSGNVTGLSEKVCGFAFERVDDMTPQQMDHLFQRFTRHATFDPRPANPFGSLFESIDNFRHLQQAGNAVHILRYEDLIADFESSISSIYEFLNLPQRAEDPARVQRLSDDLTRCDGKFFWKRKTGTHRDYLDAAQIDVFWQTHAKHMTMLGYSR
ncbi:MAG: sulfotransferase domain-containing protein [Paracoccaceae bacterium]